MSTASRYWGTFYGACGFGVNAPVVPGCFGAPRLHYDRRAFGLPTWQLGNLRCMQGRRLGLHNFIQMWPKSNPKTQIAVQWSFGSTYSHRFSPARRAKLPHSPLLFPCAQAPPFLET
jgi:hypothetical protein